MTASPLKNFVVYKSSAGSGKTFTLVKEYLRLSLHDEKKLASAYKRILAITFTNKAAAEMKSRVVQALNEIADGEKLPFVGEMLSREMGLSHTELKKRAGIVLSQILHHYSDFSIGTIDSFTHKIVKTFAYDLKLPLNFNVELDIQGFYEKVISQLFSQIGEDELVSRLLKEYVLARAEDNGSWDPEKQIHEFSRMLQKENAGEYIRQLDRFSAAELADFRTQFLDFSRFYRQTLKTQAEEAIRLIADQQLSDDDFIFKKGGPQAFFRKCFAGTVTLLEAEGPRISDAVARNKWAGNGPSAALVDQIAPRLGQIAASLIGFIRGHYKFYSLCELLGRQIYPLMLLKKIEEISQEQKQEERLVFISEFNQKIFDIIQNEPAPFIYERLGERYQHYLMDEFQDTSSLQWHNILPLLDNSLSNGWFNLIVGDGKQSIYRWRNANVRQFAALPAIDNPLQNPLTTERAAILQRNHEPRLLNTNFRSLKTIVDFNNTLFASLSGSLLKNEYAGIYSDQQQGVKNQGTGYISVHTGSAGRDELDETHCHIIRQQIRSALSNGFSYSDICVLTRKNYHGNVIAADLVAHEIPVVSSDSLLLKHNAEINTTVAYLRYLHNRQDHISAAAVITYLFHTAVISDGQLHAYLSQISANVSLFEIFKDCGIAVNPEKNELNNLFDNCVEIIRALNMNNRAYHYLRFFLDEVNEFLVMRNAPASFFFEWWETRAEKASMIIPESTNAVRIMTIHSSKGLEFPVVIIPYCNWQVFRSGDSWVNIHDDKTALPVGVISLSKKVSDSGFEKEFETEEQEQVLDNLNLLYVAFTRAVERLHVITVSSPGGPGATVAAWIEKHLSANYDCKDGIYRIGIDGPKLSKHSGSTAAHYTLDPLKFETAESAVRIKSAYLGEHPEAEEAKLQGILLHRLMAGVRSADDVEGAITGAVLKGELTESVRASTRQRLMRIIEHADLRPYYRSGVQLKLEAELVTAQGEVLRPDRIVFLGDETVIIDYKTGKEDHPKYFRQLQRYEDALVLMGHKKIKKLLVYVDAPTVITVN